MTNNSDYLFGVHKPTDDTTIVIDADDGTVVVIIGDNHIRIPLDQYNAVVSKLGEINNLLYTSGILLE